MAIPAVDARVQRPLGRFAGALLGALDRGLLRVLHSLLALQLLPELLNLELLRGQRVFQRLDIGSGHRGGAGLQRRRRCAGRCRDLVWAQAPAESAASVRAVRNRFLVVSWKLNPLLLSLFRNTLSGEKHGNFWQRTSRSWRLLLRQVVSWLVVAGRVPNRCYYHHRLSSHLEHSHTTFDCF